jgi:EAL domain-containing protein (putative c-di-GMP-specific phosphodiesterase class I)
MAYQPIVRAADRSLFAYEALLRSNEKSLPHPGAILDAAQRLGRLPELGRAIRAAATTPMMTAPLRSALFVALNASDLMDHELFSSASRPSRCAADRHDLPRATDPADLQLLRQRRYGVPLPPGRCRGERPRESTLHRVRIV